MSKNELYFKDLDATMWSGKTLIIDIDGTITPDGGNTVDLFIVKKIQELSTKNHLFLFSNKKLKERNTSLSKELDIPYLQTAFRKPNKKVLESIPSHLAKNVVVIGDKMLTDGIFAKNIRAEFIKVKHVRSNTDSIVVRLTYWIDWLFSHFCNH